MSVINDTNTSRRPGYLETGVLILLAVIIGSVAFRLSAANILHLNNPELARWFVKDDPVALSRMADQMLAKAEGPASEQAKLFAQQSIASQPLNPMAVRSLGFAEGLMGDSVASLDAQKIAHRMTRRDPITQLWLIESDLSDGHFASAIEHYDAALRASGAMQSILIDKLCRDIASPTIQRLLAPKFKEGRRWLPELLDHFISTRTDLENLAAVLRYSGGLPPGDKYREFESRLMLELESRRKFLALREVYAVIPNASQKSLSDINLSSSNLDPRLRPLSWSLIDIGAISTGLDVLEPSKHLQINARTEQRQSGDVAKKLLFLRTGQYSFKYTIGFSNDSSGAVARWELSCANAQGVLPVWQSRLISSTRQIKFSENIGVSNLCQAYYLKLAVDARSSRLPVQIFASDLSLQLES